MAWYKTGTLTVTNGQTSVTGVGTKFASNARVGDGLTGPDGKWYEIVNIASETVLGIYPAYAGTTVSGSTNWTIAPIQGYVKESADRLRAVTDSYNDISASVAAAKASETAAKTSETNAASSATAANTSRTQAATSATNAGTSATNASNSATTASTAATNATTARTGAETARDLAQRWASNPENSVVSGGLYSALHYANKAAASASSAADRQPLNARLTSIANAVVAVNSILIADSATTMTSLVTGAYGRTWLEITNQAEARTSLGLGNAAYATVVTSSSDDTAGRLMYVGYRGLGTPNCPGTADLNVPIGGGISGISSGTLNNLPGYASGSLLHTMQFSAAEAFQFLSKRETTGRFAVRRMVSGNFGNWVEPLLPGDGGVLTTLQNFESGTDTWLGNRFKGWNGTSATEGPPTALASYGLDMGYSTNRRYKFAIDLNGSPWFTGGTAAGVLGNWKKGLLTSDVVGTVSQASGVPTGAIIERGSNANGEYVRYADGTQIVWRYNATTSSIPVSTQGTLTVTYPIAFAASSAISQSATCSPFSNNDHYGVIGTANNSATGNIFVVRNGAATAQQFSVSYMTIGRWY